MHRELILSAAQTAQSIVINATTAAVDAGSTGLFIRPVDESATPSNTGVLLYHSVTGEIKSDSDLMHRIIALEAAIGNLSSLNTNTWTTTETSIVNA